MTETLDTLFEARMNDPAIGLLARTATAMRADADYFQREDDIAGGLFLSDEAPAGLSQSPIDQPIASPVRRLFVPPEPDVVGGGVVVLRTSMPEAAIDKHGHAKRLSVFQIASWSATTRSVDFSPHGTTYRAD